MSIPEHDRRRQDGYYLSNRQFWIGLIGVLSLMGLTPLAVVKYTLDSAIAEHVKVHNESRIAHPETLLMLRDQRGQMMETIAKIETKLDGIEKMLVNIAANGGFNTTGNGNWNGNGRKK